MLTYASRCALLLALAASPAELRVQSFHVAVAPVGRGAASGQRVATACGRIRPSGAVRGCSCGAGVAAAAGGLHREGLGARSRRRGDTAVGMTAEGGEAAAELALSEKTVEVSRHRQRSCFCISFLSWGTDLDGLGRVWCGCLAVALTLAVQTVDYNGGSFFIKHSRFQLRCNTSNHHFVRLGAKRCVRVGRIGCPVVLFS